MIIRSTVLTCIVSVTGLLESLKSYGWEMYDMMEEGRFKVVSVDGLVRMGDVVSSVYVEEEERWTVEAVTAVDGFDSIID